MASAGHEQLIGATLSSMAELGHQGTTVREIAARAKVTPGLVRHHFGNKEGLLAETYRHLNETAVGRIAAVVEGGPKDLDTALQGAIQALFPHDLSDVRHMRVLVAFWELVLTTPRFAEVQAQTNAETRRLFTRLLTPHAASPGEAEDIADGIIALTDGLWLECCMNPTRMPPSKAIAIALRFSRRCLRLAEPA